MRYVLSITALMSMVLFTADVGQAQVRFTFNSGGGYYQPNVTVSVGQTGNCNPGYQYPYYADRRYRRAYRNNRNQGYYYNNQSAYYCNSHNTYCTHAPYAYNQPAYQNCNDQPYWCQAHNEYCTHR
jgi:hypothetical protein